MTHRERFRALVKGEPIDRLPFWFGGPRASTFRAWRKQGLTPELERRWGSFVGGDPRIGFGKVNTRPIPACEVRLIREDGNLREWVDEWGVHRVDAIRQPTEGFATRRYLQFPVTCLADWEAYRWRFNPTTPERLLPVPGENDQPTYNPDGYRVLQGTTAWSEPAHRERLNHGDVPSLLSVPGLYWTARDWAGFEGLSRLFFDDPACVHAMMGHWTDFLITMLDGPLSQVKIDEVILNEDMAYKHAAMLSPAMMREFMLPHYRRLYRFFKEKGVDAVVMDTDGHHGQVIPVFYPEAIDGTSPMEIASHNDPALFLRQYPGIFIQGGIDKRELRFSKAQARVEIVRRYREAFEFGTYAPGVDHGVPPDVPLRNYLYLCELGRGLSLGEDPQTWEPPGELEAQLGPCEELFDPLQAIAAAYGQDDRE
ncbi:MAG: hypothetical protein IT204_03445 [Fimbriimonadaceae bacterium]|nr:hypothetical protein [Fimbriimonadaceae bacterium]